MKRNGYSMRPAWAQHEMRGIYDEKRSYAIYNGLQLHLGGGTFIELSSISHKYKFYIIVLQYGECSFLFQYELILNIYYSYVQYEQLKD